MNMHAQMMAGSSPAGQTAFVVSQRSTMITLVVVVSAIIAQYAFPELVDTLQSNWLIVFSAVIIFSFAWTYIQLYISDSSPTKLPEMFTPIPFTFEDLQWYDGSKNSKAARLARGGYRIEDENKHPLPKYDGLVFLAVKGVVYSVSHDYYGPGAGYSVFSAKDSSRQLGKVIVADTECNADWTTLDEKQRKVLDEWEARYRSKYPIVGWVVPDAKYEERAEKFD